MALSRVLCLLPAIYYNLYQSTVIWTSVNAKHFQPLQAVESFSKQKGLLPYTLTAWYSRANPCCVYSGLHARFQLLTDKNHKQPKKGESDVLGGEGKRKRDREDWGLDVLSLGGIGRMRRQYG